jgi:hypothetical protein
MDIYLLWLSDYEYSYVVAAYQDKAKADAEADRRNAETDKKWGPTFYVETMELV